MSNDLLSLSQDPLLDALDKLSEIQPLTPKQVAMILQCSNRWLEDQRAGNKPPPWYLLGDRMVRYAAGPLRDYLRGLMSGPSRPTSEITKARVELDIGLDEPMFRGGRKKANQSTFTGFLSTGRMTDEWPFAFIGDYRRPVDFIATLELDFDVDHDCAWLTLKDYLIQLKHAVDGEDMAIEADLESHSLENAIPQASSSKRTGMFKGL